MTTAPEHTNILDAAKHNDFNAVKSFIEKNETLISEKTSIDKSLALIAAENGNFDMLKYVLEKDSKLLMLQDIYGHNIFQRAIEKGKLEIVKYLVEQHKWDVSQPNERQHGNTPIHIAAKEGKLAILKYFIDEKKGDVNIRNEVGDPPVFLAADKPFLNVIKYLVEEKNADIMVTDKFNSNILFRSAMKGDLFVPKYLLDEKKLVFDINWRDDTGRTIMFIAALYKKYEFLDYIINEKKADVNIPDKLTRTALHVAAHQNDQRMCKYLVQHGANLNAVDSYNNTPIQDATDQRVINYLEDMAKTWHPRTRRSLFKSSLFHSNPTQKLTAADSSSINLIEDNKGTSSGITSLGKFQTGSFLMLADMLVRYAKGSIYQAVEYQSPLSPAESIRNKIDPLAIDSIHTLPNFRE